MISITIRHGLQSTVRDFSVPPTVAQIKQDRSLRAELGYGDNVRVLVHGVEQPDHAFIQADIVTVETAANQKAS